MTDAVSGLVSYGPDSEVLVRREGNVAVMSLNRPSKLNALAAGMTELILTALNDIAGDTEVGAVVLTGEGASFCTGMDMTAGFDRNVTDPIIVYHKRLRTGVAIIETLRAMPQPVIAAVRGHAVGAGFAFAVGCDIRYAAPDARFHAVFTRIGMSAGDLGLSWTLPRLVGPSVAAEVLFSGGVIDADDALRWGLVSRLVDDPVEAGIALAHRIAALPSFGVRMSKELLSASLAAGGFHEHLEAEMRSQVMCGMTDGHALAKQEFGRRARER